MNTTKALFLALALSTGFAVPSAFADGDGCKGSNSRCQETRAEEEARLNKIDRENRAAEEAAARAAAKQPH